MSRRQAGRDSSMDHPDLYGLSSALVVAALVLNLRALSDRPDGDAGLSLRAKVGADNRRHPLLRGTAIALLAAALILVFVA